MLVDKYREITIHQQREASVELNQTFYTYTPKFVYVNKKILLLSLWAIFLLIQLMIVNFIYKTV